MKHNWCVLKVSTDQLCDVWPNCGWLASRGNAAAPVNGWIHDWVTHGWKKFQQCQGDKSNWHKPLMSSWSFQEFKGLTNVSFQRFESWISWDSHVGCNEMQCLAMQRFTTQASRLRLNSQKPRWFSMAFCPQHGVGWPKWSGGRKAACNGPELVPDSHGSNKCQAYSQLVTLFTGYVAAIPS